MLPNFHSPRTAGLFLALAAICSTLPTQAAAPVDFAGENRRTEEVGRLLRRVAGPSFDQEEAAMCNVELQLRGTPNESYGVLLGRDEQHAGVLVQSGTFSSTGEAFFTFEVPRRALLACPTMCLTVVGDGATEAASLPLSALLEAGVEKDYTECWTVSIFWGLIEITVCRTYPGTPAENKQPTAPKP